ncbi:TetR/AcrR family transcriptional regulator [Actinomycetota bacterium Odt1-20B]
MDAPPLSRRERLRAETVREIRTVAFQCLADGGVDALSLRAIARQMGMTAAALYTYYDTRDDLLDALATDVYTALAQALEAARETRPAGDTAGRLMAHGVAYREWAVTRPHEFRLLYGGSGQGGQAPSGRAAAAAEHRVCLGLLGLVAAAWPEARERQPGRGHKWAEFDQDFIALARAAHPGLPAAAIALTLRVWGRMHGLVALEVAGILAPRAQDAARLYRDEMLDLTRSLGIGAD